LLGIHGEFFGASTRVHFERTEGLCSDKIAQGGFYGVEFRGNFISDGKVGDAEDPLQSVRDLICGRVIRQTDGHPSPEALNCSMRKILEQSTEVLVQARLKPNAIVALEVDFVVVDYDRAFQDIIRYLVGRGVIGFSVTYS